jgi:hypothetical protein
LKENGLQIPIVIDKPPAEDGWLILDGRNRLLACRILGIEPEFQVCDAKGGDAVARVISGNLRRRHDDAGVRAMQIAELLAMLKAENFPTPTLEEAAKAGGVSDRSVRTANTVRNEEPDLAAEVSKGHVSLNAANEIVSSPAGPERQQMIKEVSKAANKKEAKHIVRRRKAKRRSTQGKDFPKLKMPGLFGEFSTLLAVLENLHKLPQKLRGLEKTRHQLSGSTARQLKVALMGLKKLDFNELLAAAEAAIKKLDGIIETSKASAEEVDGQVDLTDRAKDTATEVVDLPSQTSSEDAVQTRSRNPLMRLWPRGSE